MKIICQCGNNKKANLKGYDVPKKASVLKCNYCPKCETESNTEFYEEWFENQKGEIV